MSLGTGVFLSAIFLGTIALFIATKDRWKWKRILLWPAAVLTVVGIIGSGAAFLYSQFESRPRAIDGLWGVKLRAKPSDVKFVVGEPTTEITADYWHYRVVGDDRGEYLIRFKDEKVRYVVYFGPMSWAPSMPGVSKYSSYEELVQALGEPSNISRSEDSLRRWVSYAKFNTAFLLEKNKITALGVFDPDTGPLRFEKESK